MALTFPVEWIHGAADCRQAAEPLLQVHEADEATFIFRQGKCSTFEAPFMYLLIGRTRSLLFDTGAPIENGDLAGRVWTSACDALGDRPSMGEHPFENFIIDVRA